jgi:CelD/BcsL family acetyltransferase involved in cellulose biosynthesis
MVSTLTAQTMTRTNRIPLPAAPASAIERIAAPVGLAPSHLIPFSSWEDLSTSVGSLPFAYPTWITAHITHFETRARLEVIEARTPQGVVGALSLIRDTTRLCGVPLQRLRPPFSMAVPDRFDITVSPGAEKISAAAIWQHLSRRRDWDLLELVDLPEDGPGAELVQLARAAGFAVGTRISRQTPFIALGGSMDAIGDTNAKFRANIRRRRRNLEKLGPVRLKRYETLDGEVFTKFLELEHSGWKGRNGTSILSDPANTAYHCEIARLAADAGQLAMYSLELNGEPIAMHFGLIIANGYSVPKLAYAEQLAEYAPGHLLVWDILQDLTTEGISEFDFLGNQMPWKQEWSEQCRTQHRVHIFNKTAAGLSANCLRYSVLPRARRTMLAIRGTGKPVLAS